MHTPPAALAVALGTVLLVPAASPAGASHAAGPARTHPLGVRAAGSVPALVRPVGVPRAMALRTGPRFDDARHTGEFIRHTPPAPGPSAEEPTVAAPPDRTAGHGTVRAGQLLAALSGCEAVSRGRYSTDAGEPADVPVCGTDSAVFWKADMDIDCDGPPGRHCNEDTDGLFTARTSVRGSDGRYLSAERLPYVVIPAAGDIWDPAADGVRGGCVAAIVHRDKVAYAVVGDTGPDDVIGEASYAAAEALHIGNDPSGGGTPSDVTYIVFKDSEVVPPESHEAAVAAGERLTRELVRSE